MDSAERMNSIAIDSTTALIDGAHIFQTQAIQLGEAWLKTVAESQKVTRDLTKSLLKQSLEAQSVWKKYATESAKDLNGHFGVPFEPKATEKVVAAK
jgi:hypothetical protein